jgi:hypothetical protein
MNYFPDAETFKNFLAGITSAKRLSASFGNTTVEDVRSPI